MVGRNLKRLRQRAGLTQDALGERLHVTRQAVSAWETGKNQPDAETLAALAEALGADVRELIYGPGAAGEGYARFRRRYVVCTCLLYTSPPASALRLPAAVPFPPLLPAVCAT